MFFSLEGLRLQMIYALYGQHYYIFKIVVNTDEVGHSGTRRDRLYLVLAHKTRTRKLHDPRELYKYVTAFIQSKISTKPRDYFFANPREVYIAACDLAATRGVSLKHVT